MLGHAAVVFPSGGCGNAAGTLCPQLRKTMQMVRSKTTPYSAPANTSRHAVHFFPFKIFPRGDVRSVVEQTVSGYGLWSSQDVIMRYQRHRMLFLTLSFPN